jgi:SAM-dependent methyltransferase
LSLVHQARIRRIERLTGGPGRVLDVGCGPGLFLHHMRSRGWDTRGTERSPSAAQQARDVLNLDVRAQDLEELIDEGVSYDAVVLWHVAEHVHDPATTLREIARLLRPGGVLMIGVPNFGSPEARIGGAGWFHLDVPRHLYHFTSGTLRNLLADAGLEPREVVHIAPEYDIFSFVQTAQNRLGLPLNLFYDVLRRREARLAHLGVGPAMSVVAVAAAVPLTMVGLAWAPVAAALGCSATLTIYAQRPRAVTSR